MSSKYLCCRVASLANLWNDDGMFPHGLMGFFAGFQIAVFAFVGMGREPFLWALVLAVAGLPLYAFLRLRPKKVAGHA